MLQVLERSVRSAPVLWDFTTECDDALVEAAARLGVEPVGPRSYGLAGKSAGAIVAYRNGARRWLRVTGLVGCKFNQQRRTEIESESLAGLPKPDIHRVIAWERDGIHWRAVLSALAPSPAVSETCWLPHGAMSPPAHWYGKLRDALGHLQQSRAARYVITAHQLKVDIGSRFGLGAPNEAAYWCVSHGDLHWKNLTAPQLVLLDWENWGMAPRGYDAARLMVYAAHAPGVQRKLYETFAQDFDTPSGCAVLLHALGMLKSDITVGVADRTLGPRLDPMIDTLLAHHRVGACFE